MKVSSNVSELEREVGVMRDEGRGDGWWNDEAPFQLSLLNIVQRFTNMFTTYTARK